MFLENWPRDSASSTVFQPVAEERGPRASMSVALPTAELCETVRVKVTKAWPSALEFNVDGRGEKVVAAVPPRLQRQCQGEGPLAVEDNP